MGEAGEGGFFTSNVASELFCFSFFLFNCNLKPVLLGFCGSGNRMKYVISGIKFRINLD